MTASTWTRAASLDALEAKGRLVLRKAGRQIALFHTPHGVRACNNRCPHEGYPLREGSLDDRCILTCNWHNWKFDLQSGRNLYGGEGLRTYPVEIRDGEVWIDLADPPFGERRAEILASLAEAREDNAYERMARELARLHRLGADPLDALREAIHWSFERMEFGWTHAYAGVADWLVLHDENEGDDETRLACVLEGVAHIADDVLREPRRPFAGGARPWDEEAFVAAVEAEDEGAAVAMLRGGLAAGLGFADFERGLSRAALAHYNDFGHSLIYVTKARRLIERLGPGVAEPLLLSLARGLVFATREDLIPAYRGYAKALARWGRGRNGAEPAPDDWRGLGHRQGARARRRFERGGPDGPLPRSCSAPTPATSSPSTPGTRTGSGSRSTTTSAGSPSPTGSPSRTRSGRSARDSPSCGRPRLRRWPASVAATRPIRPATETARHGGWTIPKPSWRARSRGSTTTAPASSSCRCIC